MGKIFVSDKANGRGTEEYKVTDVVSQTVAEIVSVLTDDERVLLKDVIRYGYDCDTIERFLDSSGKTELDDCSAFMTTGWHIGCHFRGTRVCNMYRSIYRKLCNKEGVGAYVSHIRNWHSDGRKTGVICIRAGYADAFERWAATMK